MNAPESGEAFGMRSRRLGRAFGFELGAANFRLASALLLLAVTLTPTHAQVPIVTQTNARVRIVAANLTSGPNQRYEGPGIAILQGLKPDVTALQEWNYVSTNGLGVNTAAAIREMVDRTFGMNFVYYRETGSTENYDLPNGIVSRFPILAAGTWDDTLLPNRGFAWAELDAPGTNRFFVVSVHLKAGSEAPTRATEASNLKALMQAAFPPTALVVLAGDMNTGSSSEAALATFKTFLSDTPIPTDAPSGGDPDTNQNRNERYDYILPDFELAPLQTAVIIGQRQFVSGLVFDSRVYAPLSDVPPVAYGDSAAANMQHMAVVKDFLLPYSVTNFVTVPPPNLASPAPGVIQWQGLTNVTYTVQASPRLEPGSWTNAATLSSPSGLFAYTNQPSTPSLFYRLRCP